MKLNKRDKRVITLTVLLTFVVDVIIWEGLKILFID